MEPQARPSLTQTLSIPGLVPGKWVMKNGFFSGESNFTTPGQELGRVWR
jgi:hypothetical protein